MFGLTISKMIVNSKVQTGRGYWNLEKTGVGEEESLSTSYTSTLNAGLYFFTITHPNVSYPFTVSRFCLPFMYSVSVGPSNGQPFVSSVSPPGSRFVNPSLPLTIGVTFSEDVYYANKKLSNTYYSPLLQFFYLKNGPLQYIYPSSASADAPNFYVTFNTNFQTGQTYTLKATPGILVDSDGNSAYLLTDYSYSMSDTNCSSHGTFDSGVCFCCNGYDGDQCERCADGFAATNLPSQPLVCSQKTGNICTVATCGCNPAVSYGACFGHCQSLGTCNDNNGSCTCNLGYAGAHCEMCATGYEDYANGCKRTSGCSCVRGTCKDNVCQCPDHWTGLTCDECASGWGGSDCADPVNGQSTGTDPFHKFESTLKGLTVFGIIVATVAVLSTIAILVYKRLRPGTGYTKLNTSEMRDFDNQDEFLEKDEFLEDDDEETGKRRDKDEEPEIEEPKKEVKKEEKLLDL